MASEGLKGIWGLEQLDRTGVATWKLGLILLVMAVLIGNALMVVMSDLASNPLTETSSEEDAGLARTIVIVTAGLVLFVLAMARTIESDLRQLSSFDKTVDTSIRKLVPTQTVFIVSVTLGLVYGLLIFPVFLSFVDPVNDSVAGWLVIFAAGWSSIVNGYVLMPIAGLFMGISTMVVILQGRCLIHVARNIKIDFLQLSDYSAIANAGVRFFLAYIPLLSFLLLVLLLKDKETEALAIAFNLRLMLASIIGEVMLLMLYGYPVWILRNRIRDQKTLELAQVIRALRGDKQAITKIQIHDLDAPVTAADLLTHQMFLESRWEWPIAAHVQKLILFGLLPPLTWVLAAVIENTLY